MFGNAAANAFIQATGITGATQKAAITQLCIDLQASGLWSKMKAVYPMVTDNYNLLSYTEDFTNAYWSTLDASITSNSTTAPNGTLTAETFTRNSNTGYLYNTPTTLNSGNYTISVYAKANTSSSFRLDLIALSFTQGATCNFNLSNGTASTPTLYGTANNFMATIENVGNGWYRCSLSGNLGNSGSYYTEYALTTTGSIYLWGSQLQTGSTLSAYQPILTTPSAFMASQMKYNLKDARDLDAAFRLTWSGGWTYSATGATPNGTNAYADTKFIPNTSFTSNNSSFSVYSRTDNINGGDVMGTTSGIANRCFMFIRYGANQSQINHNSGSVLAPTTLTSLGTFLTSRTALGHRYYVNNTLSASSNLAETGLSTVSFYIGADNTSGSAANYTNRQFAFSHIGDGLTDQESFLFNQIVEKYQVALSRGVQAAQSFYYNSAYSNEANTYLYSTQITGTTQVSDLLYKWCSTEWYEWLGKYKFNSLWFNTRTE
ncbi:hypothetical protein EB001_09525 [bacterium]|nr:hypothetical protein [bacterium]